MAKSWYNYCLLPNEPLRKWLTPKQESKGSVIWLYEDDATAMKWLIKHLYGYNFGTFIDTELQGSAKDTRDIKQSNALYVVGQKYLVPEVCTEAKTTLTALLAHLPLTDEASSENFAEFVKYVCVDYQDEAIELRELLVAHFTDNVKYVADKDRCRAVFKDVPEFAFDVMEHVMQEDDRGGSKGKAALQKKRKMSRRTSIGQHQY